MPDIEYRWQRFMARHAPSRPQEAEEFERNLLEGNTFDVDNPYIVDLASRVLAELDGNGLLPEAV